MNKNIDKEELELGQRIFQSALRVNSALTEISIILHNKEQIYTDSYYNVISEIRAFNDTFFKINNKNDIKFKPVFWFELYEEITILSKYIESAKIKKNKVIFSDEVAKILYEVWFNFNRRLTL